MNQHRMFLHATSNQHVNLMCSCTVRPNHAGYIKDLGENPSMEDVQLASSNHASVGSGVTEPAEQRDIRAE